MKAYGEFRNDAIYGEKDGIYCHSKIFDNEEFGYNKIIVERPTRYKYTVTREAIEHVINLINERRSAPAFESIHSLVGDALSLMSILESDNPDNIREDADKLLYEGAVTLTEMEGKEFMSLSELETAFNNSRHITDKKKRCWKYFEKMAGISAFLRSDCPEAEIYYDNKGKPVADASKRDTENVPLREDIDEYFAREVLPYAPDAWIDRKKTKVGYEIPMTRYFYEYQAPEKVEDIMARLSGIEADIQSSLAALFGDKTT